MQFGPDPHPHPEKAFAARMQKNGALAGAVRLSAVQQ